MPSVQQLCFPKFIKCLITENYKSLCFPFGCFKNAFNKLKCLKFVLWLHAYFNKPENLVYYFSCDFKCISCIAYFIVLLLCLYVYVWLVFNCQTFRRDPGILSTVAPTPPAAKASGTLAYFCPIILIYACCSIIWKIA